jgi:hypothetical protein
MKFFKKGIIFFLVLSIVLFKPFYNSFASNVYEKIIEDPKDVQIALDIKEVYVKDDPHKLFFKIYPYDNFDFKKESTGLVGVSIDIDGTSDFSSFEPFEYLILFRRSQGKNTIYTYKWIHGATGGIGIESIKLEVTLSHIEEVSDFVEFSLKKDDIKIKDKKKISFNFQTWKLESNTFYLYDRAPDSSLYVYELDIERPTKPTLEVSTKELDLGVAPFDGELSGSFTIRNVGLGGKLDGTIKATTGKMKVSPDKFSLSFLEKVEVSISVSARDFGAREFLEKVSVESNGGSATVNVKFKFIPKPELDYSPSELNFGDVNKGEKASLELRISNKKEGSIKGSLKTDLDFISFSKKTFEGASVNIKVEADTSSLEPAEYSGTISITTNGGNAEVPVNIRVLAAEIVIEPDSIDFGDIVLNGALENPKKAILIKNRGNKILEGDITSSVSWLKVEPSSFSVNPKEDFEIEVSADLKLLEAGKIFSGELAISSNGGNITVPVKLRCLEPQPILSVLGKDSKEFREVSVSIKEAEPFSFTFFVKNIGGGKLDVKLSFKEVNSVFKVSSEKFSLKKGDSKEIILTFKESPKSGTYKDVLIITSNAGESSIPINVVVQKEKLVIKLYIGKTEAFINDKKVSLDVPPYIKNGTTFVPIRFISEAFGAEVKWDANIGKGQVTINYNGKTIILRIDSKIAFVNGKESELREAPEIRNGRTFVPIRFISEAFGAEVKWNAVLQEVIIEL